MRDPEGVYPPDGRNGAYREAGARAVGAENNDDATDLARRVIRTQKTEFAGMCESYAMQLCFSLEHLIIYKLILASIYPEMARGGRLLDWSLSVLDSAGLRAKIGSAHEHSGCHSKLPRSDELESEKICMTTSIVTTDLLAS
jgi:hypothetical protein